MKFMTKGEAHIEANLLRPYEIIYPRAVEAVATALRARFESGKLRGWISGDSEIPSKRRPSDRLRDECAQRYITSPMRALGVLAASPSVQLRDTSGLLYVERWHWDRAGAGQCLLGAAEAAMALDVLHFARERGWSKPQKGEEPAFKRARRAS